MNRAKHIYRTPDNSGVFYFTVIAVKAEGQTGVPFVVYYAL